MTTPITDHVAQALARVLTQYKDRTLFAGLLSSPIEQIQDLEDNLGEFELKRSVYGSVGVQLDLLGTIVDIARNGLDDDHYRLLILGKIGENSSNATMSAIVQIFAILLESNQVQGQDLGHASVGLSAAGPVPDVGLIPIIYQLMKGSIAAGVNLDFLSVFDETGAFAFEGGPGTALGFDDLTDPGHGGMLATLLIDDIPFAFDNPTDPSDPSLGLGTVLDPVVGGNLQSL